MTAFRLAPSLLRGLRKIKKAGYSEQYGKQYIEAGMHCMHFV